MARGDQRPGLPRKLSMIPVSTGSSLSSPVVAAPAPAAAARKHSEEWRLLLPSSRSSPAFSDLSSSTSSSTGEEFTSSTSGSLTDKGLAKEARAQTRHPKGLLTNDTLQAHYNYYHSSHHHHHTSSSSSCEGGMSCHSPGSCPTCDNNVEPHFHTYIPEVPRYVLDLSVVTTCYLPESSAALAITPSSPLSSTSLPSSNISSPFPSPRSALSDSDFHSAVEGSSSIALPPRSSSTQSLLHDPYSTQLASKLPPPSESSESHHSPPMSPKVKPVKSFLSTLSSSFSHHQHSCGSPRGGGGNKEEMDGGPASPGHGLSSSASVKSSTRSMAASGSREYLSRTAVELLSYRLRIAIDKSLYRISELHELERRVIAMAVDNSAASRESLDWCRRYLIRPDTDIVVVIRVWEEITRFNPSGMASMSGMNLSPKEQHKQYKEHANAQNKLRIAECKKLIGSYYKEFFTGCDVYPLLLPVDKFSCHPVVNDGDSCPSSPRSNTSILNLQGRYSSGHGSADNGTCHPQHIKSAIAAVLCRAVKVLRADHLVLGCRHYHKYPNTYNSTISTNVNQVLSKCPKASNSRSAAASPVVASRSSQCSEPLTASEAQWDKMIGEKEGKTAGVALLKGKGGRSESAVASGMRHSASTPHMATYGKYVNEGGTNAAAAIRRLFRGSVSHYLLKNMCSTCNVVLVKTNSCTKQKVYAITSSRPLNLASEGASDWEQPSKVGHITDPRKEDGPKFVGASGTRDN
eukprot:GHVS01015902.1.p1 GENE.GHVS01015902.1~~GHVS01015902.1.p1  ORF type:complete len:746 (+),score=132.25 GHVS01015902.1:346-2583(+)